jgi:hypothetical protein
MSGDAKRREAYEARVLADILMRLPQHIEVAGLPFSQEELTTLAKRSRQHFHAFRSEAKKAQIAKYMTHLAGIYGESPVNSAWAALERINNEIGYEEK